MRVSWSDALLARFATPGLRVENGKVRQVLQRYIHIYVYMYLSIYRYVYVCIYRDRERERERESEREGARERESDRGQKRHRERARERERERDPEPQTHNPKPYTRVCGAGVGEDTRSLGRGVDKALDIYHPFLVQVRHSPPLAGRSQWA